MELRMLFRHVGLMNFIFILSYPSYIEGSEACFSGLIKKDKITLKQWHLLACVHLQTCFFQICYGDRHNWALHVYTTLNDFDFDFHSRSQLY